MNSEFTISPAIPEQLPEIVLLEQLSFSVPWSAADFREFLTECSDTAAEGCGRMLAARFFVALDSAGEVCGYICARRVIDEGEILSIAVSPKLRRRGIARALMQRFIEGMRRDGAVRIFLDVRESNTNARALYTSLGFEPISVRRLYYRAPNEDAIVMMLCL